MSIARQFSNTQWYTGTFSGFGPTKNKAVELASNDWVLSLDADECLDEKFVKELKSWVAQSPTHRLGCLLRDNYFIGKKINHSGWNSDWVIRLFNRRHSHFNNRPVHESIVVMEDSIMYKFTSPIRHNTVENINQSIKKIRHYSELAAPGIVAKNKLTHRWMALIFLRSLATFTKTYLLQLGVLDGWRGFVIAWCNANGVFFKYLKAYIKYKHDAGKHIGKS